MKKPKLVNLKNEEEEKTAWRRKVKEHTAEKKKRGAGKEVDTNVLRRQASDTFVFEDEMCDMWTLTTGR